MKLNSSADEKTVVNESLSPKQVARAIGVSESSLKRWCDRGLIPMIRTAGGHRRLPVSGVLRFLRQSGQELAHPEVLGLPARTGKTEWTLNQARNELMTALVAGEEALGRQIIFDLFLANHQLSVLFDDVVAAAFREIGKRWEDGQCEVYQERRACEIMLHVFAELRSAFPQPVNDAPRAIGGTLEGDWYQLASTMAELILRETGYNAAALGASLPVETLIAAMDQNQPKLLWISVSYIESPEQFLERMAALYEAASSRQIALAVGGRALTEELRTQMEYSAYCDTMRHLEAFGRTLLG